MKTNILLLAALFAAVLSFQTANAQEAKEPWPGVTSKILFENDIVKISEVTFAAGAVADWHSHPDHTIYAVTDVKVTQEEKGKEPVTTEYKAGSATFSAAVTHKSTNAGKKPFTAIITEMKLPQHKH